MPNRLRDLRDATVSESTGRRLTRRELAIDLDVTEATVFRWEMAKQAIPDERKEELARYFGVSVASLMGWPESRPPD